MRDNRPNGGGLTYDDSPVTLSVINTGTPFKVIHPNTATTWGIGSEISVAWDVSSTDLSPINCSQVNILLSLDGGYTYPVTLLTNTPNDGSEVFTLPNNTDLFTDKARIMVQSAGNVFFDISDINFVIDASVGIQAASVTSTGLAIYPNPTNGLFNISLSQGNDPVTHLFVKDIVGRAIIAKVVGTLAGQQEF